MKATSCGVPTRNGRTCISSLSKLVNQYVRYVVMPDFRTLYCIVCVRINYSGIPNALSSITDVAHIIIHFSVERMCIHV